MNRDPHSHAATGLRQYVGHVADELGDEVWAVDCDVALPPATALLFVRARIPTLDAQQVLLTWDEVNGWAIRVTLDDDGDTIALAYLAHDLLATPGEVAAFLRDGKDGKNPGTVFPPCFRGVSAEDDLDLRLACFL